MNPKQLLFAVKHPAGVGASPEALRQDDGLLQQLRARAARLPMEGRFPSLEGATAWLNSEPLTSEGLRGKVVLVEFLTYTCINWLRTLSYVRAWAEKYSDHGLVVIGVHTPEFPFERDIDNVRTALREIGVDFPIAMDSDYEVWSAFANHYWPALYFIDGTGQIRHHHFGEGSYDMSEMVIQLLLADAGLGEFHDDLVSSQGRGIEAEADWANLETPETYVGYERGDNFESPGGLAPDERHAYSIPSELSLNSWALSGDWTIRPGTAVLDEAGGRIAFRFHGRDLHLVMGPGHRGSSARFRVFMDGEAPGAAHGIDVDEEGNGVADEPRLYQLIRQRGRIDDRTFEIEFLDAGAQAYSFTFG